MTPDQLISSFTRMSGISDPRDALLYVRLFAHFLGDNMLAAKRKAGRLVSESDAIGFLQWIEELEAAASSQLGLPVVSRRQEFGGRSSERVSRFDFSECPDCGHVHADEKECGFPIGAGRICRCERSAVTA